MGSISSRHGGEATVGDGGSDGWEELSAVQQASMPTECDPTTPVSPMGSQQEADEQRLAWGLQWGTGLHK